jgi:hypothetical protein
MAIRKSKKKLFPDPGSGIHQTGKGKAKRELAVGKEVTKGGTYPKYKKKSKAATSFREAFKANCKTKGAKSFTWNNRSYACATKDKTLKSEKEAAKKKTVKPAVKAAPKAVTKAAPKAASKAGKKTKRSKALAAKSVAAKKKQAAAEKRMVAAEKFARIPEKVAKQKKKAKERKRRKKMVKGTIWERFYR